MDKHNESGQHRESETDAGFDRRDMLRVLAGLGIAAAALSGEAQDAAKINPRSYKVVFDNDKIRVLEYESKPGLGICGQGRHYHPAHATVQLTDAKVKLTTAEGKIIVVDAKAGTVFPSPAEWHTTENVGGVEARAYIIEFKDADWKPSTG
jgi:beta-alanine degradation protein BauB